MNIHKESLPEFDDIRKALASKSPFRLTNEARNVGIRDIAPLSEDDRRLLLNALLCDDTLRVFIGDRDDLGFVVDLLKQHDRIQALKILLLTSDDYIHKLAPALETSHVTELDLTSRANHDPILRALKHNKTLRKLILNLEYMPYNFDSLVDALSNENLEEIKVPRQFTEKEVNTLWPALKPVLSEHKSLKTLALGVFNSTAYQILGEVLVKNTTIQRLELRISTADDMTLLCNGLVNNSTLCNLHVWGLKEGAASVLFASLAHDRCQLSSIHIEYMILTDEDIRQLNESLKTNTKLTELIFHGCGLYYTFSVLCEGLKHNNTVKHLCIISEDLSHEDSMTAMCDMLMHNDSLTALTLSYCVITDEQCHLIGAMLKKNKSLTDLALISSQIDDGFNSVCEALVHNTTLKKLILGPNQINVQVVKNVLVHNRTLRHLEVAIDLDGDSPLMVDLICEGIKHNDNIANLRLDCKPNATSLRMFIEALQANYALDRISLKHRSCPLKALAQPLLQRNRQLKSDIRFKVAILSHNIARSSHALTILPREIWKQIISLITSPGMEPFSYLVETIFKSYE